MWEKGEGADLIVTRRGVSDRKGRGVIERLWFLRGFGIEEDIEKMMDDIK